MTASVNTHTQTRTYTHTHTHTHLRVACARMTIHTTYTRSKDPKEYIQYFQSFKILYRKLSEGFGFDYIFIDLGPNHEKLNMAFVLSAEFILPPLHADFFSVSSVYRLVQKDGVLDEWLKWAKKFKRVCEEEEVESSDFEVLPKLLPFLVSGYQPILGRKKNDSNYKRPKTEERVYGALKFKEEVALVEPERAMFIGMIEMVIDMPQVPDGIRSMMLTDNDRMVIPFVRNMHDGNTVSQAVGIPQQEISEDDIKAFWVEFSAGKCKKVADLAQLDFNLAGERFGRPAEKLHENQKSLAAFIKQLPRNDALPVAAGSDEPSHVKKPSGSSTAGKVASERQPSHGSSNRDLASGACVTVCRCRLV